MLFERILDIFWQNRPILQISVTWTHREIYSNFSTFPNSNTKYIKSRLPYENAPWVFATTSTLTSLINEETRNLLLEFFSIHLEKILPSRLLIVKKNHTLLVYFSHVLPPRIFVYPKILSSQSTAKKQNIACEKKNHALILNQMHFDFIPKLNSH